MLDVDATAITRLRTRFVAAQGRVAELPDAVRVAATRLVERVRTALDLPSRTELVELTARLEELDRRISELASAHVEQMSTVRPSLPAPSAPELEAALLEQTVEAVETVEAAPVEASTEANVEAPVAASAEANVEAASQTEAAEPAADTSKDARRRKIGRRASANKTSRR